MSFSDTDLGTLGIMIIGLGAVGLIITLAVTALVNHWRQLRN